MKFIQSPEISASNHLSSLLAKLRSKKGSKYLDFSHIFHCDGLILCSTKEIPRLVVWNPCTGQRRNIKPRACYRYVDIYALGYSTSVSMISRSYKILRCGYYQYDRVGECEMYEFCSDSWRVLDSFTLDYTLFFNSMSLRGDTYFVGGD
ncbi:unnamed protein product, partial [Brassica oleracea var. botrytis]